MTPETFTEALRATARVACCAALLGCTPKGPAPTAPAADANASTSGAADPTPVPAGGSEACRAQVASFFEKNPVPEGIGWGNGQEYYSEHMPAETRACCQEIVESSTIDQSGIEPYSNCCVATGIMSGMCTPWGPPRPPEASHTAGAVQQRVAQVRRAAQASHTTGADLDLRQAARVHAPHLPSYPSELRALALATWRGRMINEYESHVVFLGLAERLAASGGVADAELARCRAFADEERQHGILCGAVVEALGGAAQAAATDAGPMPAHADAASPLEAALRDLLSVCCLSETVAVALIGAERLELPEGALRELLTRIYADECGHAHFGWRLLPDLLAQADAPLRARLSDYLVAALAHLEEHELAHLPAAAAPAGGAALGLCDGRDARRLFYATVEQVILPGLEAQGLAAHAAWAARRAA